VLLTWRNSNAASTPHRAVRHAGDGRDRHTVGRFRRGDEFFRPASKRFEARWTSARASAGAVQAVSFQRGARSSRRANLLITIDPAGPYAADVETRAGGRWVAAQARQGQREKAEFDRGASACWDEKARSPGASWTERVKRRAREAEAKRFAQRKAALQNGAPEPGATRQVPRAPSAGRVGRLEVTIGKPRSRGSPALRLLTTAGLGGARSTRASMRMSRWSERRAERSCPGPGRHGAQQARKHPGADEYPASAARIAPPRAPAARGQPGGTRRAAPFRVRAAVFDNFDGALMPGPVSRRSASAARNRLPPSSSTSAPSAPTRTRSSCSWVGDDNKAAVSRGLARRVRRMGCGS